MFESKRDQSAAAPPNEDWPVAVAALYRTYAPWLTAFLARRFGREIAEDLAQETFLRLAQHPLDWRSPKALLARIALNVGQDHLRREKAQKRPRLVTGDDLPEGVALPDQHETLLHREVVAELPRNLRDVYVLSRFGGLTYRGRREAQLVGEVDGGRPTARRERPVLQALAQRRHGDMEGLGLGLGHHKLRWPGSGEAARRRGGPGS